MKSRIFAALAVALTFSALVPAPAVAVDNPPYSISATVTSTNTDAADTVTFGFPAGHVCLYNTGANTAYFSWDALATSTPGANVMILPAGNPPADYTFARTGPQKVGLVTASSTTTVLVYAFQATGQQVTCPSSPSTAFPASPTFSGTVTATTGILDSGLTASQLVVADGSKNLASNGAITTNAIPKSATSGATLVASHVTDDGTTVAVTSTATTVSGTLGVTGVTTMTAQPIVSSLTASQLVASDGSKGLVSNGAITTGALPKSVSSGATLAASALSDDGTKVTSTEPIVANASIQGNYATKALTSGAAAAAFVVVAIPTGTTAALNVEYCYEATDNTDFQARCGIIPVTAVNKAGTITCLAGTVTTATEAVAVSAGTLTATTSCADGGSGNLQIKGTDTSSLTIGAGYDRIRYRVSGLAPSLLTVTAQ